MPSVALSNSLIWGGGVGHISQVLPKGKGTKRSVCIQGGWEEGAHSPAPCLACISQLNTAAVQEVCVTEYVVL